MASTTPAADTAAAPTTEPGAELEFRARHSLTIDAMAHTLLPIDEAKRLGAVPLGKEGGRTVIAVADPAESRLAALRELSGASTKFVLIAPEALSALLKSRIFNDHHVAPPPPPLAPPPPEHAPPLQQAPPPATPPPPPQPAAPEPVAGHPPPPSFELEAVEAPPPPPQPVQQQPRYEPQPLPPPRTPAPPRKARRQVEEGELADLAAAVAGASELLAALQERITDFASEFDAARKEVEEARQEAREHKEKLAALSAKADQDRARVRSFANGLHKAFAGLEKTKSQLSELIEEE